MARGEGLATLLNFRCRTGADGWVAYVARLWVRRVIRIIGLAAVQEVRSKATYHELQSICDNVIQECAEQEEYNLICDEPLSGPVAIDKVVENDHYDWNQQSEDDQCRDINRLRLLTGRETDVAVAAEEALHMGLSNTTLQDTPDNDCNNEYECISNDCTCASQAVTGLR